MTSGKDSIRYGIGELYGLDFSQLSPKEIRHLITVDNRKVPCPFKPQLPGHSQPKCSKPGGICSLRKYTQTQSGLVKVLESPVTTCPERFLERKLVFQWVGETLLGTNNPVAVGQLPFLMSQGGAEENAPDAVGKIDNVLVNPDTKTFRWCALEMQAVYFSGDSMDADRRVMRTWKGPGILFPLGRRRPDFRSSGPKRLMPQLQVKVPTIARWGKKMAVVVDKEFWQALGQMRETRDLSNSEIVWFVVSYAPSDKGRFALQKEAIHFTTLGQAVEGLTGGTAVSLERFENEIRARMPRALTN